ncbi:hypothetical protein O3M35_007483 [Rhynocoris fuscipes]|uniref:Uncharacterized protein n=1 Tax=Rhynocoris fuscipes TaxID=488301 RepID=A0AAW1DB07_9HEMI
MPKIVKMSSGRLKTDISGEIWKSNFFKITILPLFKEVKRTSLRILCPPFFKKS